MYDSVSKVVGPKNQTFDLLKNLIYKRDIQYCSIYRIQECPDYVRLRLVDKNPNRKSLMFIVI